VLNTSILLTPKTLIGRVTTTLKQRNITYGETSALPGRAASWAAAAATKTGVVSSPSTTSTPNVVVLTENETSLINFTDASGAPTLRYSPLGRIPQLIGVAYPPCSGITWRNGRQRTHGKRTGLNQMGIIVSNNITSFDGLQNQSWNPWMEFIYDVADAWRAARADVGPRAPPALTRCACSRPCAGRTRRACATMTGSTRRCAFRAMQQLASSTDITFAHLRAGGGAAHVRALVGHLGALAG
jgi:hypothetical protein